MHLRILLWRNIKWRFKNKVTILVTIIQPLIWLVLYSSIASDSMYNYTAFILPGIMVLVMFGACSSSGMMNYIMKKEGSFYRLLITPVNRTTIIFAQNLEAIIVSFLEVLILVFISLFMSVSLNTNSLAIIMIGFILFITGFLMANIAYIVSLKLPNEMIYETMMNMIVLPLFFTSSALFPIESIKGLIRILITINPFTHVINIVRELLLTGTTNSTNYFSILIILSLLSILLFTISNHVLNKETDE